MLNKKVIREVEKKYCKNKQIDLNNLDEIYNCLFEFIKEKKLEEDLINILENESFSVEGLDFENDDIDYILDNMYNSVEDKIEILLFVIRKNKL